MDLPLERDEGEYAYAGQLLLQGVTPYEASLQRRAEIARHRAWRMRSSWRCSGKRPSAIHAGVILVNLATAVLVFVLARRMYGDAAGVVAAGTYALLSIVPATLGLAAHATHFVMLPALAGIVLLQNLDGRTLRPARIFSAGLLIGLAVLMKQTGAAFGLVCGRLGCVVRIFIRANRWRRRLAGAWAGWRWAGCCRLVLTCLILALTG